MEDFNGSTLLNQLLGLWKACQRGCRDVDMTSCISHTLVELIKAIRRTAEIRP